MLFHAEIASRDPVEPFDIDDIARGLTEKMVRRHPHVFAGEVAETPEQVLVLWNAAKAAEEFSLLAAAKKYDQQLRDAAQCIADDLDAAGAPHDFNEE